MILSDREVRSAVARRIIGITEMPGANSSRWASHALDLTLDAEISLWNRPAESGMEMIISPGGGSFNATATVERYTTPTSCEGDGFVLNPGQFILGWTVEKVRLPYDSRIGARVEGKSSLARIGLGVHVTAPTIHPGFGTSGDNPDAAGSSIRLEMFNLGVYPIRLLKGMAICQVLFEEVHGVPEVGYGGQFAIQGPSAKAPTNPKKPGKR
jgi:dCTP deaminase